MSPHVRFWNINELSRQQSVSFLFFNTDQISEIYVHFKLRRHWIMHHGHEVDVDDEADDDHEVKERVRDNGVEPLFEPPPTAATVPLQEEVGQDEATWRTQPLVPGL